jgi:hypothetical protein
MKALDKLATENSWATAHIVIYRDGSGHFGEWIGVGEDWIGEGWVHNFNPHGLSAKLTEILGDKE